MEAGDRLFSPIFGEIEISEIYDTEAEAREAGYYYDAMAGEGPWKVLGKQGKYSGTNPDQRFCACRVKL